MEKINTHSFAELNKEETGYTFLCTTNLSRELDKLFGFDYIRKFASDAYEPELFVNMEPTLKAYLKICESPVEGLSGRIKIPVSKISKEIDQNIESAYLF